MMLVDLAKRINEMYNAGLIDTNQLDFTGINLYDHTQDNDIFDTLDAEYQQNYDNLDKNYDNLGHYDEQTLFDYIDATDENGNWLHPYNTEY